jgi:hypothetical protein
MSDTRRWVLPGFMGIPCRKLFKTRKHIEGDHPTIFPKQGGKFGRFSKYVKNSRYNLLRKIEQLDKEEVCES